MVPHIDEDGWESGAAQHEQALALWREGQLAAAESAAVQALSLLESALPGGHVDSANAACTLADLQAARGDYAAALAGWRHALALLAGDGENADEEPAVQLRVNLLRRLGETLTTVGEFAAAADFIAALAQECARRFGPESLAMAHAQNLFGVHHKMAGRYEWAQAAYAQASALYERHLGRIPVALTHNLAGLCCAQGDFAQAEKLSRAAIAEHQQSGAQATLALGRDLAGLGDALSGLGRLDEAVVAYREALATCDGAHKSDHAEVAFALHNLADALAALGRIDEAVQCYHESIRRKEALFGTDHYEIAASLHNLAGLCASTERRAEGLALLERAVRIALQLPADHPVRTSCIALREKLRQDGTATLA